MFKTNFSEHNKIWGTQKRFWSDHPRMSSCLRAWAELLPESLPLGFFRMWQQRFSTQICFLIDLGA